MKKALATTLAALCLSAHADVFLFGNVDCGEWVRAKSSPIYTKWLMGFLSGLNTMHVINRNAPPDPLHKLKSDAQAVVWMNNYCSNNPLKTVAYGGVLLFNELKEQ